MDPNEAVSSNPPNFLWLSRRSSRSVWTQPTNDPEEGAAELRKRYLKVLNRGSLRFHMAPLPAPHPKDGPKDGDVDPQLVLRTADAKGFAYLLMKELLALETVDKQTRDHPCAADIRADAQLGDNDAGR